MFDVGFAELLVLTIIAMVVIGPEKLPGVARSVGKTVGKARRIMTNLQNQIEQEVKLDELNKKIMADTDGLDVTKQTIHPSHQTEDAEVPPAPPSATGESSKTESTSTPSAATVEQGDSTDQAIIENDAKRS